MTKRRLAATARDYPTILLVEDAQDDRQMYAEYLRQAHFRILQTDNPEQAIDLAAAADTVVTGIRLPGTFDGVELVRRLRAAERTRTKPVIVLTACTLDEDRQRALDAGCDLFLAKPCLPDALLTEIQRLLAGTGRPPARAASRRQQGD